MLSIHALLSILLLRYFNLKIQFSFTFPLNSFQDMFTGLSFPHLLNQDTAGYIWSSNQLVSTCWSPSMVPSLSDIKGCCCSINKQFSIDSFLDWEGHHWVFTLTLSDRLIYNLSRPQHCTYSKVIKYYWYSYHHTTKYHMIRSPLLLMFCLFDGSFSG